MCAIEVIRRENKKNKKLQAELDKNEDTQELEQMIKKMNVQIEEDHKSYLYDEIDEGFWLRYNLGTWLRQVVDELAHT
jgi:spore coat protein CotH